MIPVTYLSRSIEKIVEYTAVGLQRRDMDGHCNLEAINTEGSLKPYWWARLPGGISQGGQY